MGLLYSMNNYMGGLDLEYYCGIGEFTKSI